MTEFEYTDRLAELLKSLQEAIFKPLRLGLKGIQNRREQAIHLSIEELEKQTDIIEEERRKVSREMEENVKRLEQKGEAEENCRNDLIQQCHRVLTQARQNSIRIHDSLKRKGLVGSALAEALENLKKIHGSEDLIADAKLRSGIDETPVNEANLAIIIREASQAFIETEEILSGPLANYSSFRFNVQRVLFFSVLGGGFTAVAIKVFKSKLDFLPSSLFGWALAIGGSAFVSLLMSFANENKVNTISEFLNYPKARREVRNAYEKLIGYTAAIECGIPKRIKKLEFEKKSNSGDVKRSLAESLASFTQAEARIRSDKVAVELQHESRLEKIETTARDEKAQLTKEFAARLEEKRGAVNQFLEQTRRASAEWDDPIWNNWEPDPSPEFAARIGTLVIEDEDLTKAFPDLVLKFSLPALVPFGSGQFLLFEAEENAHAYIGAIQSLMLRALANVPPGKLRFTFIDPVGLGQSVAPFMALGDLDEQLISGRAWSESQHIDKELGKLTEHMEMVIQKYLRHDYATIKDYNHTANEVAEPFRFLVIFDFPTNFNDSAIRRLVSIIRNGPRCGIFTLMMRNTAKRMPYGFNFDSELRSNAFSPYHQLAHSQIS